MANKRYKPLFIGIFILTFGFVYSVAQFPRRSEINQIANPSANAHLYFVPDHPVLTTTPTPVTLWVTTSQPLAFVHVTIAYNPSLVKLAEEAAPNLSNFKRLIAKTSQADANRTGKLSLTTALNPGESSVNNTHKLATLMLVATTPTPNQNSELSLSSTEAQLVGINAKPVSVNTTSSPLIINPRPESTPSPSPSVKPDPKPLLTASPLLLPSPSQKATPIPSAFLPTQSSPSPPPPLRHTREAQDPVREYSLNLKPRRFFKWTIFVTASADNSHDTKQITYKLGDQVIKSCSQSTCSLFLWPGRRRPYTLTVSGLSHSGVIFLDNHLLIQ